MAHNTTIKLEFRANTSYPIWHMNGDVVRDPWYEIGHDPSTGDFLGILTIDGNETCGNVTVSCRVVDKTVYTERLNIEGL